MTPPATEPTKATEPDASIELVSKVSSVAAASAVAPVGTAAPEAPRASGNGFTVLLPETWAVQPDPKRFKAARTGVSTIAIDPGSNDTTRSELTRAGKDRVACDRIFESLSTGLQIDRFVMRSAAGCEREAGIGNGTMMIGIVEAREGRPYFALCGGTIADRESWEPECRAIIRSLRWDATATAAPFEEPAVDTQPMPQGEQRVVVAGVAVTVAPGWTVVPQPEPNRFAAIRRTGIGVMSFGVIDAPLELANASSCREMARLLASELSGSIVESKLDAKRCTFFVDGGSTLTDGVIRPGPRNGTLWVMCVRSKRDPSTATECEKMTASIRF